MRILTVYGLIATALFAVPAAAQKAPFVLKFDASVGFGRTLGGGIRDVPVAFDFGATAAAPLRVRQNGVLVVGVAAQSHWPLDYGTSCMLPPGETRCIPAYPKFTSIAALVGWELVRKPRDGGPRVLMGPAVFRTDEKETLLGVQGRFDFGLMVAKHFGLVLWSQAATASPHRKDRYFILAGGMGLRLQ